MPICKTAFFIADVSGTSQQADGGEVMTVVRNSILAYVDGAVFGASKTNS
jgi:hypothetical protein